MSGSNRHNDDDEDGAVFNPILHASATDVNSDSHKDSVTSHYDLNHENSTTNNTNNKKPPLWGTTRSSRRSIYDNDTGSTSGGGNSNSVFNPLLKLNNAVSDVIAPINSAMAPILPRYIHVYILSCLLVYLLS